MKRMILTSLLVVAPTIMLADMDRCVSCHGVDFEKKALGVSKIVKDMSEKEIKSALDGYKRGEGGRMKNVMIREVNLGVDTDAMAADVYNEAHTPGFEEPDSEFIFKKRRTVRTLHKLKMEIKKSKKEDLPKIVNKIKSIAFTYYSYDPYLRKNFNFDNVKPNSKELGLDEIYELVKKAKFCTDHSFTEEKLAGCRSQIESLAVSLVLDEAKAQKAKAKKKK